MRVADSKAGDVKKADIAELTIATALAGASLVEPTAGILAPLLEKLPSLWERRKRARAEKWLQGCLEQFRDSRPSVRTISEVIVDGFESNDEAADVMLSAIRDAIDATSSEAAAVLGALYGAYHSEGREFDDFFYGMSELMLRCSSNELASLRDFVGHIACVCHSSVASIEAIEVCALFHGDGELQSAHQRSRWNAGTCRSCHACGYACVASDVPSTYYDEPCVASRFADR